MDTIKANAKTWDPIMVQVPDEKLLDFSSENRSIVMHDLCADQKNVIKAVTITFRPEFHKLPPKVLNKMIRSIIKQHVCNSRSRIYAEVHFEFTKSLILHGHCVFIGRKSNIARLCALLRRSCGFLYVKTPADLQGWIKYCSKEDIYDPKYYYN